MHSSQQAQLLAAHFSPLQVAAIGTLMLGLRGETTDRAATDVTADEAIGAVEHPTIRRLASKAPSQVEFEVVHVADHLIHEDVEYPHLFDTERFVEAYAHQGTERTGERVTLIYASDDMAVLVEMQEAEPSTAWVVCVAGTPEVIAIQVAQWKDQSVAAAIERAKGVLGALPRACHVQAAAALNAFFAPPATSPAAQVDAFVATIPQGLFSESELQLLQGLADRAKKRLDAPISEIQVDPAVFWNLRQVIRDSELPDEEEDGANDRVYLRLAPFDLRLKRESEGIVIDVFSEHDLEPLATAHAFYSDADAIEEAEEDTSA